MLQIDKTIVSLDIINQTFCCDLNKCKGRCCVEGVSGAPLEEDEIAELEKALPTVWDELSPRARQLINEQGVCYKDASGETVTSIVDGKDCVFTYYDEKGVCYCALEKAWREGKSSFIKPISCHLYPIRLSKLTSGVVALNYQQWHVCVPALAKGKTLGLPIYRFLREPLIRKFGQDWYDQLCEAAKMLEDYPRNV
jgi:hypothetical protein